MFWVSTVSNLPRWPYMYINSHHKACSLSLAEDSKPHLKKFTYTHNCSSLKFKGGV